MTHVVIIPRSGAEAALWRTTAEIAVLIRELPWVVVGGQMVMMLELEHGRPSGRATRDLDAIVDVRAVADGTRIAARRLLEAEFAISAEHPHRFVRGQDSVDLLAPPSRVAMTIRSRCSPGSRDWRGTAIRTAEPLSGR